MPDPKTMRVGNIKVNERSRKDSGDLTSLKKSMQTQGLISPILVTPDGELVCGYRRLQSAKELNWTDIGVHIYWGDDKLQAEYDENECRKPFTYSEKMGILELLKRKHGSRQGSRTDLHETGDELLGNCQEVPQGETTREYLARESKFGSERTMHKAEKIAEQAVRPLIDALDRDEVSIDAAALVADLPQVEQVAVVEQGPKAVREKAAELRKAKKPRPQPEKASVKLTRLNGQLVEDTPEIAALRASGKIQPEVIVNVEEPVSFDEPSPIEPPERTETDLSDEEWLAELPLLSQLSQNAVKGFCNDALNYRRLDPHRKTFLHHANRLLKGDGDWTRQMQRALKLNHPKHWKICPATEYGGCGGTGEVPAVGRCPNCYGRGYRVK